MNIDTIQVDVGTKAMIMLVELDSVVGFVYDELFQSAYVSEYILNFSTSIVPSKLPS